MRRCTVRAGLPPVAALLCAVAFWPAFGQDAQSYQNVISPVAVASILEGGEPFEALGLYSDIETFAISDRTYALAVSELGIQIIDVTDPASPAPTAGIWDERVWQYYEGQWRVDIFVASGSTYAITANSDSLQVLNVTVPAEPAVLATIQNGHDSLYALRHLPQDMVGRILAEHPHISNLSYSLDSLADITAFTVSGGAYALVASWEDDTVQVVDLAMPQAPVLIATMQDGSGGFYALSQPQNMEVFSVGDKTYALISSMGEGAIQVVDLTEPGAPRAVASLRDGQSMVYDLAGHGESEVFWADGRAYALVSGAGSIQVIDVTVPTEPLYVSDIEAGPDGWARIHGGVDMEVFYLPYGTFAIVPDSGSLQIIDVTVPAEPVRVSSISVEADRHYNPFSVSDVEVFAASNGTYALISDYNGDAIGIFEVSEPANPVYVTGIRGETVAGRHDVSPTDMEVFTVSNGTYALVPGSGGEALRVIDVSVPSEPRVASSAVGGPDGLYSMDEPVGMDIFEVDGAVYALVSSGNSGVVQVLNLTDIGSIAPVAEVWDGAGKIRVFDFGGVTYAVLMSDNSMQVLNLAEPAAPYTVSGARLSERHFHGFADAAGIEVFEASGKTYSLVPSRFGHQLLLADITDVMAPEFLNPVEVAQSRMFVHSDPMDMELFTIYGRPYMLVPGYDSFDSIGTVQIIDVTRPQEPVYMATILGGQDGFGPLNSPIDAEVFTVHDRAYAMVVDYGFGSGGALHVMDVTDPSQPAPVVRVIAGQSGFDAMDDPFNAEVFVIDGATYAIVSNPGGSQIQIVRLAGPTDALPE